MASSRLRMPSVRPPRRPPSSRLSRSPTRGRPLRGRLLRRPPRTCSTLLRRLFAFRTLRRLVSWVRLVTSGRIPCLVREGSSWPARPEMASSRLSRSPTRGRPLTRPPRTCSTLLRRLFAFRTLRRPVSCLRSVTSGRIPCLVREGSSWPARPEMASSRLTGTTPSTRSPAS